VIVLDDRRGAKQILQVANPAFKESLLLLGIDIVRVLREFALRDSLLELLGQRRTLTLSRSSSSS
jgi:hypothetical protein